jgi:hypothetical protein
LQLFLELGFLFFKYLVLLFQLIKFSRMLTISFIKLVPSSKSFIKDAWQFLHSSEPRCSNCLRSDTKPETSRKTDWQHPTCATDDMSDHILLSKDNTVEILPW